MEPESWIISDLVARLSFDVDPWRLRNPFSQDIKECQAVLFDSRRNRAEKTIALSRWLSEFQPCLFGRMEAKLDRLYFCLLTENDLERSDGFIREKIQHHRLQWRRQALDGKTHGFLIVALAEAIARARPSRMLLELATRICQLYLGVNEPGQIHLDELDLEIRAPKKSEWRRWNVGVNYFSAQGDGLYHTDETIPSAYFDEGLWRREDLPVRDDLYFTYLHRRDDDDYLSMGLGIEFERGESGSP